MLANAQQTAFMKFARELIPMSGLTENIQSMGSSYGFLITDFYHKAPDHSGRTRIPGILNPALKKGFLASGAFPTHMTPEWSFHEDIKAATDFPDLIELIYGEHIGTYKRRPEKTDDGFSYMLSSARLLTEATTEEKQIKIYLRGSNQFIECDLPSEDITRILNIILADHYLPPRVQRLLSENGYITLGDILDAGEKKIRSIKYFGGRATYNLKETIEELCRAILENIHTEHIDKHIHPFDLKFEGWR